jgi:hypothetical protein
LRVSNSARYTTAFTPSQSGFTVDANTKLYIKGTENNGVTTFVDSETTPKTVTTAGDTKIKYTEDYRSCIFKDETGKFPYPVGSAKVDFFTVSGSGVGYFDGTNSSLSIGSSADFSFPADFTGEGYYRFRATSGTQALFDAGSVLDNKGFYPTYSSGNGLSYSLNGTGSGTYAAFAPIVNTWYHIAVSRSGSTIQFWVNGIATGASYSNATATDSSTYGCTIGNYYGGNHWLNALSDNIRISKGIARFTAAFNPEDDSESAASGKHRMFQIF